MIRTALLLFLLAGPIFVPPAFGQCMLANPSFEIAGTGGQVFGAWNQFGPVASTSTGATHGAQAVRLTGPNAGGWDVAGVWQQLDTQPGETWTASVRGWHTPVNPLTGASQAILNIEWRDAGGGLLSYESHTVADAATPTDTVQDFTVVSGPAPAGAVATRFLLGVLQSPSDPAPDVYFDEATFASTGPPTPADLQWTDFPGGRTLTFGGRTWRVKGPGFYGPGPNLFADDASATWVDANGRLHLTIRNVSGSVYSTEVTLEEALGYGDYVFTTYGRLDTLHENAVFGLFLWEYRACWDPSSGWWNPYNEMDIEFSRWGNPASDLGQFVAQPFDWPGNINRFAATFSPGEITSHAIRWLPDRVEFRSWRGGPADEAPGTLIHSWTYTGPHISRPEQPRVHLNLWYTGTPPTADQEVVLDDFTFVPACLDSPCVVVGVPGDVPAGPAGLLSPATPNPFGPRTSLAYRVPEAGRADLTVYDVTGRSVRTLAQGRAAAGSYRAVWDGRDDAGRVLASGVYFVQLRTAGAVETRRVVLVR